MIKTGSAHRNRQGTKLANGESYFGKYFGKVFLIIYDKNKGKYNIVVWDPESYISSYYETSTKTFAGALVKGKKIAKKLVYNQEIKSSDL